MKQFVLTRSLLFSIAATLASGALYYFSTGLTGFRPLVWIAPLPVLVMATRSSRKSTATSAFGAYILGGFALAGYFTRLAPLGVVIASLVIPALAFMLVIIAYRDAMILLRHPFSFAAFPVGWTSYEFLLSIVSPHGTAGSIAYTQADLLPLVQISSLTGIFGISFILTLVPAGLAAIFHYRENKRFALVALSTAFIVTLGSMTYGWMKLAVHDSGPSVRVGLGAINRAVRYAHRTDRERKLGALRAYARMVSLLSDNGSKIVVLPEKIVGIAEEYENDAVKILTETAKDKKVLIIAGLERLGAEPHRNLAMLIGPEGNVLGEYDKVHLISGLESEYRHGTKMLQFQALGLSGGIAICKDLDFPRYVRKYGEAGVGVLFVPAWDFGTDAWLHSRMAVLRGVENGFALVRSASDGYLSVSDEHGRMNAESIRLGAPEATLVADVHPGTGRTFYAVYGDWFPIINLFALLILLTASIKGILHQRTLDRDAKSGSA